MLLKKENDPLRKALRVIAVLTEDLEPEGIRVILVGGVALGILHLRGLCYKEYRLGGKWQKLAIPGCLDSLDPRICFRISPWFAIVIFMTLACFYRASPQWRKKCRIKFLDMSF